MNINQQPTSESTPDASVIERALNELEADAASELASGDEIVTVPPVRAHLLFVDDEKRVLNSMRALFRRHYNVQVASSGAAAVALVQQHHFDVIVSDQRMPGMTGVEVLKQVKQIAPNVMRILLTGYADTSAIEDSINEGEVFRFLSKPCPAADLKSVVAQAAAIAQQTGAEAPTTALPEQTADTVASAGTEHLGFQHKPIAPAPDGAEQLAEVTRFKSEVLVLSADAELLKTVTSAAHCARKVRAAKSIQEALQLLTRHPIGVLVTDIAIDHEEVRSLTGELKSVVPELITIVASERTDAHKLIDLINFGQIFRFFLKPVTEGQCRINIESALRKNAQLIDRPELVARHQVVAQEPVFEIERHSIASRFSRFRDAVRRLWNPLGSRS